MDLSWDSIFASIQSESGVTFIAARLEVWSALGSSGGLTTLLEVGRGNEGCCVEDGVDTGRGNISNTDRTGADPTIEERQHPAAALFDDDAAAPDVAAEAIIIIGGAEDRRLMVFS